MDHETGQVPQSSTLGGGNNPPPEEVISALTTYERFAAMQARPNNSQLLARIDSHRQRIARFLGCDADELAVTRNSTEGLNIVIHGLDLKAGDEVVYTNFDAYYGARPLRVREARHGLVLREVTLPIPPNHDDVVAKVRAAFNSRTRLLVASHMADGWGFVLPIERLAKVAREHGAQFLVDGALTFAHLTFDVRSFGCDYYVSSLHKWLSAPLGTGILYVRRDRIGSLWPLYGASEPRSDNVRKFEEIGTRSGPTIAAIGQALDFHEAIGPERKTARLRYLARYVLERLTDEPRLRCFTERDESRRGSLMRIVVDGLSGQAVETALRERFGIFTFGGLSDPPSAIYIAPNLFNLPVHLDRFVDAMRVIARGVQR
jgi:isopenicillin-N epimerase